LKRVELLTPGPCPPKQDQIISRRLGELGWIVGQTIVIDCVSAIGRLDGLPVLAREMVSRRPDVLGASPSPFIKKLKQETTTIPIVMLGSADSVGYGLVTNLARPEANVTGVAFWGRTCSPNELNF